MTLTKTHFEALAEAIRACEPTEEEIANDIIWGMGYQDCRVDLAERIATICGEQNPSFDRERFIEACGL